MIDKPESNSIFSLFQFHGKNAAPVEAARLSLEFYIQALRDRPWNFRGQIPPLTDKKSLMPMITTRNKPARPESDPISNGRRARIHSTRARNEFLAIPVLQT